MAQISYGTITITDTNDIECIYVVYAKHTSNTNSSGLPAAANWKESIAEAPGSGNYIWQRTVVKKSGITTLIYGDPVCVTGPQGIQGIQGIQGPEGEAATNITDIQVQYGISANWNTQPSSWSNNSPDYDSIKPNYWTRTRLVYEDGTYSDWIVSQDHASTEAIAQAVSANSIAQDANENAQDALSQAAEAQQLVTHIDNLLGGHFLWHGNALSQATPSGARVVERIKDGSTDVSNTPSKWLHNVNIGANGISLRYNEAIMAQLAANQSSSANTALKFYQPPTVNGNTTTQGNLAMELSGSALKFYDSTGTIAQATFGGNKAVISGTINVIDGQIGNSPDSYWYIGNYLDYQQNNSAAIKSYGTAFIQLGNSLTWRVATNRIHSAWNNDNSSGDAFRLHFPSYYNKNNEEKYWDVGLHLPQSINDKFLYVRNATKTETLENLNNDLEDSGYNYWEYQFWVDGAGNVHAPGFFIGNSTTPIGGGAGTVAERLTQGYGSATQPIYFNSSGVPTNTTYTLNAAGAKGVDTSIGTASTSTNLPTSQAVATFVEGKGYITSYTDNKVQTSQANTTKIYVTGTPITGTSTSTLNFDSNVYLTTTAGTLHATIFEGNLSGTASRATADSDGNTINSTYLKLSGGNVTGAVTFGSSVSVDELTAGDLVVNGNASFTNNAQFNTINGVAVGSSPKFTDTTYSSLSAASGGTAVSLVTTGEKYTWNNKQDKLTNPVTGTGTSGYLAKWNGSSTVTTGPTLGTDATKFLNNKGEWAVPAGTYTYTLPLAANGTRGGVQIGYTQSGKNYPVQLSSEKMYVNVPWENTWTAMTGATSSADGAVGYVGATPPKSGYNTKYWRADGTWSVPPNDNTHRPIQLDSTEILGNNTTALNLVTGGGMALSNSSGSVTIAHKDTSSQATSTNSGRTYIQSITLDTYGHVTGLSTATESVTDTHYTTHLYAGKSDGNVNAATTNGNTYLMVLDNTTVRDRRKISGSGAASVTSDANGNITINSPVAITGVSFADGTITFTKSDSTTIPITTDNFVITQASGATALVKLKSGSTTEYEGYSAGGATTAPVYFDSNGHPAAVTSIPWGLIADKPSSYTPSSHSHGNITNGGDITTTATIASGDRLVINDESESKINNSSITFGTSTTTFLTNKGTWATPVGTTYTFDGTYNASSNKAATVSTVTNAINALDGGTIGTPSASKTVTAISQTNGNISVTFGDISITKSQISDFPTSMTPAAHTHDDRYYTETEIDNKLALKQSVRSANGVYNPNAGIYVGGSGAKTYTRIILPDTAATIWGMYLIEVSIRGNYGEGHGGKVLINGYHTATSPYTWTAFNATVVGHLPSTVAVYGSDGKYLYVKLNSTYQTASIDKVLVGDTAQGYDLSAFTIDFVDALPSTYQTATMYFTENPSMVSGHTVGIDVPSTAKFTDTWNALSTSQAGYVSTAPNDTTKFLRGDAQWAQVSSANLSDIRLTWSSSVSTTDWILAHDTAATGTPLFRAMSPANLKTTMSLNNVENTKLSTWAGSSNITTVGTITSGTWNGSAIPIANGGTGATTAANAINALLGGLPTWTANPTDTTYFIRQDTGGAASYGKVTFSTLWSYISGKISSSGTYVTIGTDQTITANQKTFNGAIRWGTASKYGAAHYDSTLEAIVFSFV